MINHGVPFVVTFVGFTVAFAIVNTLFQPIQRIFIDSTVVSSLVFLPHGIRVIATWCYGPRAILPLFLADVFSCSVLWAPPNYSLINIVQTAAIGSMAVFVVMEAFRFAGHHISSDHITPNTWRELLLVGGVSSYLNGYAKAFTYHGNDSGVVSLTNYMYYFVGDLLGTFASFFILIMIFRFIPKRN